MFLTSGFVYDSAEQAEATFAGTVQHYQYSRFGNPTVAMLENGWRCWRVRRPAASPRPAWPRCMPRMLCHLRAGDRWSPARALFGSCHWIVSTLLPRYGIDDEFVDGGDLDAVARGARDAGADGAAGNAVQPDAGDRRSAAVCELAHAAGALVVVDNVFATPLLQQPLQLGADVVVYSCDQAH